MVSGVQVMMAWSSQLTVVSSPGGKMVQHSGQRPWWPDGATPSSAATPSPDTFGTGGCSEINMNQSLGHRIILSEYCAHSPHEYGVHSLHEYCAQNSPHEYHKTVYMNTVYGSAVLS